MCGTKPLAILTISSAGADPSDAIWQSALRNVVYSNTSDTPPASRAITVTASDDQGSTGTATDTVNITAVNDAPVIDLNGAVSGTSATLSYVENGPLAAIAPSASVTDVDSPDFNGGSLRVSFTQNGSSSDQLAIVTDAVVSLSGNTVRVNGTSVGTVSGGANGADLVISFNSGATQERVAILTQHVGYSNTSDNPSVAARTVSFTVNDGDGTANGGHNTSVATATINVTSINDAPVASNVTASGNEDASSIAITLKGTDVDGSIASFKLTGPLPSAAQGHALYQCSDDECSCRWDSVRSQRQCA